ncbi:hypothetical protein ACHAXH_002172 [Discostella pseudostelligera]
MSNRNWHKRLRQSLEITRRRSFKLKQSANADVQPDDRSPPTGSDPNTLVREERDAKNETNVEFVDFRRSDAQVRDNNDTTLAGNPQTETMSTAADLIVDDFPEKDTEQNNQPSQSGPTVERDDEQENTVMQREEREEQEGKDITASSLVMGDNDGGLLTGKNSIGLTDNSDMMRSESSLSNGTFLSINTEYNIPPKDAGNNEAKMQPVSSSREQPTVWGHILSLFGFSGENEKEEEDAIDDTLSQFVLHNVKQDLEKRKSNRGVSKGNKKEVGSGALLHKINKIKKIIRVLEAKRQSASPAREEMKLRKILASRC